MLPVPSDAIHSMVTGSSILAGIAAFVAQNRGWLCVFGGLLIHLVLGTLYIWGNITNAVTSYIRIYEPSVTYNESLMVYATALAFQGGTMFLGGVIERRIGAQKTCLIGGYVLVLGTLLSAAAKSLGVLIITDGVLFGIGLGMCYSGPIAASVRWMPNRKGLVTGIIVAGFGGGSFLFGMIATRVINPNQVNIKDTGSTDGYYNPESVVVHNVPKMFVTLGICYFLFITFGSYMLSEPPLVVPNVMGGKEISNSTATSESRSNVYHQVTRTELDLENVANTDISNNDADSRLEKEVDIQLSPIHNITVIPLEIDDNKSRGDDLEVDLGPRELLSHPLAWHLASCFITTTVGGMYLAGTFKTYAQKEFTSELFLSTLGSIAAVFNAVGRIFWGALADYVGPTETLIAMSLVYSVLILTYSHSTGLGQSGFAFWTCCIFFFEGANFALYLPITVNLFGTKNSAANYGLVFTCYSILNVINITILAGFNTSFHNASLSMGILTFIGFINLVLFYGHMKYRSINM